MDRGARYSAAVQRFGEHALHFIRLATLRQ